MRASPTLRAGAARLPGGGAAGRLYDPDGTGYTRPAQCAVSSGPMLDGPPVSHGAPPESGAVSRVGFMT